jgi:hypothetical protein
MNEAAPARSSQPKVTSAQRQAADPQARRWGDGRRRRDDGTGREGREACKADYELSRE